MVFSSSLRRCLQLGWIAAFAVLCAPAHGQGPSPRASGARTVKSGARTVKLLQPLPVRSKTPRPLLSLGNRVRLPGVLPIQHGTPTQTTLRGYIGTGDVKQYYQHLRQTLSQTPVVNLEVRSNEPKVAWLAWQVCLFPFPSGTTQWERPPGLVDCRVLGRGVRTGNVVEFPIDLGLLARVVLRDHAPVGARRQPVLNMDRPAPGQPRPYRGLMDRSPGPIPVRVDDAGWFYIRVVPLTSSGELAGPPSNTVAIEDVPPSGSIQYVPMERPDVHVDEWSPVRFEDFAAAYHVLFVRDLKDPLGYVFFQKGQHVDMTPHAKDDGFWSWLCDTIEGFFNFIEKAVNWVSNAYADLKNIAINLGCSVLGEWARQGLEMALDAGLVAIGLPPSLPDFDDLASMGKDYLANLAEEEIGVPGVAAATGAVIDEFCKQTRSTRYADKDNSVWFVPDPDFLYHPAHLWVTLRNTTSHTTVPLWLEVRTEGTVTSKEYVTDVFQRKRVPIPALRPGATLRLPIYLDPQLDDPRFYSPETAEVTSLWWQNYDGKDHMVLSVSTLFRPTKTTQSVPTGGGYTTHFQKRITGSKSYRW